MRLTLRTLLAWLDDTLPPSEVREIGKQVGESPFARELVDRIHRVARQRRLTVPSTSGPDSTDPNLVAAYLDNELDADLVNEFEKVCLTSDVHLAEVASTHQILSLIGQKAKVPTEARNRMYYLIRGRETTVPKEREKDKDKDKERERDKERKPAQPAQEEAAAADLWMVPEPPRRPWIERFGPVALVVLLIAVLFWSAYSSLSPPAPEAVGPVALNQLPPVGKEHLLPQAGAVKEKEAIKPVEPKPAPPIPPTEEPASEPTPTPAAETKEPAKTVLPLGSAGRAEKPAGILLRYNSESRQWDQLTAETPLRTQDRLLNLKPFRTTLELGAERARVDLVEETEVWALSSPPSEAAHLNLAQGRVVLHGLESKLPFAFQFGNRTVSVTPPPGLVAGVERLAIRQPGTAEPSPAILRFYAPEGEVKLAADDAVHTLHGPAVISFDNGQWTEESAKPSPSWVTEPKPSSYDEQVGDQFAKLIHPGRPIITEIVAATEDPQIDVRRLAILALRAVGDISYIVPLLGKRDDPGSRRAAIGVLRAYLSQGPAALKELRNQLQTDFGGDQAATVEKLLVGYTSKEAREDPTYATLVQLLGNADVGVRELALDNLQSLTGRDDLDYDPDKPDGRGLRAWKDLQRDHELRQAGARKGETTPAKKETATPAPASKKETTKGKTDK